MKKKAKKKNGARKEFTRLLSKKQPEELEKLRESFAHAVDERIDAFYTRRDLVRKTLANRVALGRKKVGVWKNFLANSFWKNFKFIISMPFIYAMIIPAVIMHVFLILYQNICFRLYGIPLVSGKDYFVYDRTLLPYLNWLEKFHCAYCSYFNGLVAYAREIAGRTERFWCPIKHARRRAGSHKHYAHFTEYGDKDFHKKWDEIRKF